MNIRHSGPNLLIIGAMKSGTTTLWKHLSAHPSVFMTLTKEPGFFVNELNWSRGWGWYHQLFADAGDASIRGEASTHYTKAPEYKGVPDRIAAYFPHMRFIYLMREPVARAVSHYWHAVHYNDEIRSMARAIRVNSSFVNYSCYATQLKLYFEHFPRENFYITTFERLRREPATVIRDCYEFLGVDSDFRPDFLGEKYNAGPEMVRKARGLLRQIRHSRIWTSISPFIPNTIKDLGKRYEYTCVERSHDVPPRVRQLLTDVFRDKNEELFKLLNVRYPEWEVREERLVSQPDDWTSTP
jgi:hypothetical protein